jgi:hypothetical protein
MIQCVLTPAAGKRLIAKAVHVHIAVQAALQKGTIAIIAGTTNGYVAEEILRFLGQLDGFYRSRFFRGITLPHSYAMTESGRLPDESKFPGDVIIVDGIWQKGKTIFDVVDDLKEGDVILKGANAVDLLNGRAGILIGHPKGGTIASAIQAVVGRRVRLIIPVGVEKRVSASLDLLAAKLNDPQNQGPRFLPVPGEVVTELNALAQLTGCAAEISAGGGVCGAEGSVWVVVSGDSVQEQAARKLLDVVSTEEPFDLFLET